MIVYSTTDGKACHVCSIAPNSDWTGTADFVIDDNDLTKRELIAKIKQFAPYFDYVTNEAGELVDVVKTGEVEEETPEPTTDDIINILLGVE